MHVRAKSAPPIQATVVWCFSPLVLVLFALIVSYSHV